MAKRKAAPARRKTTARRTAASRPRGRGKAAARKSTRTSARRAAPKGRKTGARTTAARKAAGSTAVARKAAARKAGAAAKARTAARKTTGRSAPARKAASRAGSTASRRAPALDRQRKTVTDDIVPSPPSSLDLDRSASSVRSGRRELRERFDHHTETSPAITGGDVDADWESAYSVGDEAPGGDNPTPDQDIVDEIGRAVGVQYDDNEELKGEKKISDRDRKRWELDPASSEDYEDR